MNQTQCNSQSEENQSRKQQYPFEFRLIHQVRRISVFKANYPSGKPTPSADSIIFMARYSLIPLFFCLFAVSSTVLPLTAQTSPGGIGPVPGIDSLPQSSSSVASPLVQPTLSPGALLLLELDGRFEKAVAAGGGKAFVEWLAEDAVTLNNGKPAVLGRAAIAAQSQWDPKTYQLTWSATGRADGPIERYGIYLGPL